MSSSIPPFTELTADDEGNLRELVTDEKFSSIWRLIDNHLHGIAADGLHQRDPTATDRYDALCTFRNALRTYLPTRGDDAGGAAE